MDMFFFHSCFCGGRRRILLFIFICPFDATKPAANIIEPSIFFVLLFWILWKTPMQATHFSCLSVSLFAGRTITHTIWWCCCCCCLLFAFVSWVVLICVDFLFDCSFFAPAAALPANVRKCHNNRARLSEETKKKRKKRQERAQFFLGVRRTFFGMAPEQR